MGDGPSIKCPVELQDVTTYCTVRVSIVWSIRLSTFFQILDEEEEEEEEEGSMAAGWVSEWE